MRRAWHCDDAGFSHVTSTWSSCSTQSVAGSGCTGGHSSGSSGLPRASSSTTQGRDQRACVAIRWCTWYAECAEGYQFQDRFMPPADPARRKGIVEVAASNT